MLTAQDLVHSERWQTVAKHLSEETDGLGMPIDPGIMDTCIVLNVLGFTTIMSCEGHVGMNKFMPAPWVIIENSAAFNCEREAAKICEDEHVFDTAVVTSYQRTGKLPARQQDAIERANALKTRANLLVADDLRRLVSHFHTFYADRPTPPDQRLIACREMAGTIRLLSQGTWMQVAFSEKMQQHNLKRYQREMDAFTAYLMTCC